MKPQETKYSFIYREIKQSIINGRILPGDCLPSSRMLCSQFHVSRYTINRVFDALKKEGLIDIKPRLAPIVLPGKVVSEPENMLFDVLSKRKSIMQIYKTFAFISPPLLVFAAQDCNLEIMPHYKQAMKASRLGTAASGWRPSFAFLKEVLEIGGNPLLANLYSAFELYHFLNFFMEKCPYFLETYLQGSDSMTADIIDILKGRDPVVKHSQLDKLFQRFADSIAVTLEYLADSTPGCPVSSDVPFLWKPTRGKDYFYSRIISDLNQKIGSGEYPCGTYLPFEKQLAGQYDVSVSTIRKALNELEQRGLVKTLNAKGTIVIEPDDSRVNQMLPNPRRTQEALQYFHALQLLTLIIYPAALAAGPKFTVSEVAELEEKFILPDSICIIDIFEALLKHIELEPLRAILIEAFRLTEWGHYIAYYANKKLVIQKINKLIIAAVQHLHGGKVDSFANGMTDCYRFVLERAKEYMIKKYNFYRVAYTQVPEKYQMYEMDNV